MNKLSQKRNISKVTRSNTIPTICQ